MDSKSGLEAKEFLDHCIIWKDTMFDMSPEEIKRRANDATTQRNGYVFVESTWKELKLSIEWYEERCRLEGYNEEAIMREIDLKRIHGSSLSPFRRQDIIYLAKHEKTPIEEIDWNQLGFPILIYEKIRMNKAYILSVDPAEGLSNDNHAWSLINPSTLAPVAEFECPYISQKDLFLMLNRFLDEYCPKSMIIVENNRGRELLNYFYESKYRYQLYYDDGKLGDAVVEKTDPHGRLKTESLLRRAYGITTTRSNRPRYFAVLENFMDDRKELLFTKYLVRDISGLIRKPNGRIESGPGMHDDSLFSYLIGCYVYLFSEYEHLAEFGIKKGELDTGANTYDEKGNITQEGTLSKLREMFGSLPAEMQALIAPALQQRDEMSEAIKYQKMIQRQNSEFAASRDPESGLDPYDPSDFQVPTQAPMDQAFWQQYDENIFGSNYNDDDDDGFGGGGGFNIEDWI